MPRYNVIEMVEDGPSFVGLVKTEHMIMGSSLFNLRIFVNGEEWVKKPVEVMGRCL